MRCRNRQRRTAREFCANTKSTEKKFGRSCENQKKKKTPKEKSGEKLMEILDHQTPHRGRTTRSGSFTHKKTKAVSQRGGRKGLLNRPGKTKKESPRRARKLLLGRCLEGVKGKGSKKIKKTALPFQRTSAPTTRRNRRIPIK